MTAEQKTWMTADEVAEYIGITITSLSLWRSEGRGPRYSKLSDGRRGRIRYNRAAVDEWMASREREVMA